MSEAGELGVLLDRLDEDAAQSGTAARHQAHVVAEQQGGPGRRRADPDSPGYTLRDLVTDAV
jgi:hypothetical protein